MKKYILVLVLLAVPSLAFADDGIIRSNILAKLLDSFVMQVTNIDYILGQTAQAQNPAQFATFKTLVQSQLDVTTQQIATLLNSGSQTQLGSISPVTPTPAVQSGGTITPSMPEDKSAITVEVSKTSGLYPADYPYGLYLLKAEVLDANGLTTPVPAGTKPFQNISMIYNGTTETRQIDGRLTPSSTEWYHTFQIAPTQAGTLTISFASGTLTKTVTIDAQ